MQRDRDLNLEVLQLLASWERGTLDEEGVWWAAEELDQLFDAEYPDPVHAASAKFEPDMSDPLARQWLVLGILATLPHQLITRDDIPAMRQLLEHDNQAHALAEWDAYYTGIDWESRRATLAEHPLYGPFTKLP